MTRHTLALVLVGLAATACQFNRSGIAARSDSRVAAPDRAREGPATSDATLEARISIEARAVDARGLDRSPLDRPRLDLPSKAELGAPDHRPPPDHKPPPDLRPPDLKPPPDQTVIKPVTAAALVQLWQGLKVPCIGNSGQPAGADTGILDSGAINFVAGSITLAGATSQTKTWVGTQSSVTIIWDPRSCGQEDPINRDSDWGSAGLLVRGAKLDSLQRLVLEPWVTVSDIDFLDVTASGAFEGSSDFANADDSALSAYPQLVPTVNAAKQGVLTAAGK